MTGLMGIRVGLEIVANHLVQLHGGDDKSYAIVCSLSLSLSSLASDFLCLGQR